MKKLVLVFIGVVLSIALPLSGYAGKVPNPLDTPGMQVNPASLCKEISAHPVVSGMGANARCANCIDHSYQYVSMSGCWILNGATSKLCNWTTVKNAAQRYPTTFLCGKSLYYCDHDTTDSTATCKKDYDLCGKTILNFRACK